MKRLSVHACIAVIATVCSTLFPTNSSAAEVFTAVRTFLPPALQMPRGVRNIGMASTGTAEMGGLTSRYNPAGLAWTDATMLSGDEYEWRLPTVPRISVSEIRASTGYASLPGDGNRWRLGGALSYGRFAMEPFVARTVFLPEGTEWFEPRDAYIAASVAGAWERGGVSIGVGGTARHTDLAGSGSVGWTHDVGVLAAFSFRPDGMLVRPRLGAATLHGGGETTVMTSIGPRRAGFDSVARLGIGLDFTTGKSPGGVIGDREVAVMGLALDYDVIEDRSAHAFGVEASLYETFMLRFGTNESGFFDGERAITFGAGFHWDFGGWLVKLDAARIVADAGFLGDVHENVIGAAVGARLW